MKASSLWGKVNVLILFNMLVDEKHRKGTFKRWFCPIYLLGMYFNFLNIIEMIVNVDLNLWHKNPLCLSFACSFTYSLFYPTNISYRPTMWQALCKALGIKQWTKCRFCFHGVYKSLVGKKLSLSGKTSCYWSHVSRDLRSEKKSEDSAYYKQIWRCEGKWGCTDTVLKKAGRGRIQV